MTQAEDDKRRREEEAAAAALLLLRRRQSNLRITIVMQVQQELDKVEPVLAKLFRDRMASIANSVQLVTLERLIENNDTHGIVTLLFSDGFHAILEALRSVFIRGGQMEMAQVAASLRQTFDVREDTADAWLRGNDAQVIQMLTQNQREAIGIILAAALLRGQSARKTALQILGRKSAQTGRRSGGIVGLTGQDATWIETARQQLASGEPSQMRDYLKRTQRDRTFDPMVKQAIETGKPLSDDDIERVTGAYASKLSLARAAVQTAAWALAALAAGRSQAIQQIVKTTISADRVSKVWRTVGDNKVRHTHTEMNGQVQPFFQPFRSPSGALLMEPGDSSLGAGPAETFNCRCSVTYRIATA